MGCESSDRFVQVAAVFNGGKCEEHTQQERDPGKRMNTSDRLDPARSQAGMSAMNRIAKLVGAEMPKFPSIFSEAQAAAPQEEVAQKGPTQTFDRPQDGWGARNLALLICNTNAAIKDAAKKALPQSKDPLGEIFFASDREKITGSFFFKTLQYANTAEIQRITESIVTAVIIEVAKAKKSPTPNELKEMLERNLPTKTI